VKYNHFSSVLIAFLVSFTFVNAADAQTVNNVAESITDSVRYLPSGIAAIAYLSGIIMALWGITKTIDHVTNPSQTPIRMPVIRFLVGGALFSLPIIIEAAFTTINGGFLTLSPQQLLLNDYGTFMAGLSGNVVFGGNFNSLMGSVVGSIDLLPALVAATAYLLGVLLTVSALYKVRDHIDDPSRITLKEPVIRILTAGALFALPTLFTAMYETLTTGLGFGSIASIFNLTYFRFATETSTIDCAGVATGGTLGRVICNSFLQANYLPGFLTAISYLLGLVMGVWGVFKLRDHALNPTQTTLWDGLSRFLAGGAFFAFPAMAYVINQSLVGSGGLTNFKTTPTAGNSGFNESVTCTATGNSLDQAMACFMQDIAAPSQIVVEFFAFAAGLVFIMIGISRLVRSAQEGPKGPGGIGTLTTFVIGGILLSANTILKAISDTLFATSTTATFANLAYTTGMSTAETDAVYNVISAVLKFMIILGIISFVRGLFIIRDVAEGNQQASTMAAMTHIIGGALAVNLGPLMNAVLNTLGITGFGITFT